MMQSVFIDSSIMKRNNGPGSYNIESMTDVSKKKSGSVVDWSRSAQSRFSKVKDKNPGPGSYSLDKTKASRSYQSSSFAY